MNFKECIKGWIFPEDASEVGFIHMRTPNNRMELRADFNNYDDLIRAVKAIKEEARILYKDTYKEIDFS